MNIQKKAVLLACTVITLGCLRLTLHHAAPSMPPPPEYAPLAVVRIVPTRE